MHQVKMLAARLTADTAALFFLPLRPPLTPIVTTPESPYLKLNLYSCSVAVVGSRGLLVL